MMKKKTVQWIIFGFFIVFALLLFLGSRKYEILNPKTSELVDSVYALGTVKTDQTFNLRTSITSKISRIFVSEGDFVAKNTALVLLDSGLTLIAPFGGVINKIYLKETENTIPGQPILSLINFDKMYVSASLDQDSVLKVRKGQKVEISLETIRNQKAKGVVTSVYPSGTEFIVKIKTTGIPSGVLPEMTCDIAIEIGRKSNAVLIPAKAVINQGIIVLRDKKKIMMKPQLGSASGEWIEVLNDGVKPSDLLIVPKKSSGLRIFLILFCLSAAALMLFKILRKKKEA